MIDHPPQLLKEMTSSAAFRCVQVWLLEKPAAWADDPCLAAAQMAQQPPNKRPREDALLEAERSHQRRRIEILDAERSHKRSLIEHLEVQQAEVKRLEERLRDLGQVKNEVDYVSEEAVYGQATRAQRAELALRWFEANAAWGYFGTSGDRQAARPDPTMRSSSVSGMRSCRRRRRDVEAHRGTVKKEVGAWGLSVASAGGIAPTPAVRELSFRGFSKIPVHHLFRPPLQAKPCPHLPALGGDMPFRGQSRRGSAPPAW